MRAGTLTSIAIAALLVAAPTAQADATATFDDLSDGTTVSTQYQDLGGTSNGVVFGADIPNHVEGKGNVLPVVDGVGASLAHSGTNVGELAGPGCNVNFPETCNGSTNLTGHFPLAKELVRVFVGAYAGSSVPVKLTAFTESGLQVGTVESTTVSAGTGFKSILEVDAPKNSSVCPQSSPPQPCISYFEVRGANLFSHIGIDDLTFDTPVTPPPPSFTLSRTDRGNQLDVVQGRSASATLQVFRKNLSNGDVNLSVSGLPPDVHATLTPSSVSHGTEETKFTLTLRADPGAHPLASGVATVTATGSAGAGGGTHSVAIPFRVLASFEHDVRISGLEVTQGIQFTAVTPNASHPGAPVEYRGVALSDEIAPTVVRLYANDRLPTPPGGVPNVTAELRAFAHGHELPGGPIYPVTGPRTLDQGKPLGEERKDPKAAFTFVLPFSWQASAAVKLKAKLVPPPESPTLAECDSTACRANNRLTVKDIPFFDMPEVTVAPVKLKVAGVTGIPRPRRVFEPIRAITPLLVFVPDSYLTSLDITGIANSDADRDEMSSEAAERVQSWSEDNSYGDMAIGVGGIDIGVEYDSPIIIAGEIADLGDTSVTFLFGELSGGRPVAVTDYHRPLTSVGHEFGHTLGRLHADHVCGGEDDGSDDWGDPFGTIEGVGLDVHGIGLDQTARPRPVGEPPYTTVVPGPAHPGEDADAGVYDYMAYCGPNTSSFPQIEPQRWIGTPGWQNLMFDWGNPHTSLRARLHSSALPPGIVKGGKPKPTLLVHAMQTKAGVRILSVTPETRSEGPPPKSSSFAMTVRGAGGNQIAKVPAFARATHVNRGGPVVFIRAAVPIAGRKPASIELTRDGTKVASRVRSAHAPTLAIRSPGNGDRVGAKPRVPVRWKATDADGDRLTVKVDYSTDGGKRFRTIFEGANSGRADLDRELFAASKHARIRIRANDGFNETTKESGEFTAVGLKPRVEIETPEPGARFARDGQIALQGMATDDALRRLRGKRLGWFVGKRKVGTGENVTVTALPPGRRVIRLVATDRLGRRTSASVSVRIRPVPPVFSTLTVPKTVGPKARKLTLRVAASLPSKLAVSGAQVKAKTFAVGRRIERLVVRLKKGTGQIRLRLALRSAGKVTRATLAVRRRAAPAATGSATAPPPAFATAPPR